jgi:hypothetical protein
MLVSIDKTYKTKCGYEVKIYAIYENQTSGVHGAYFQHGMWCATTWKLSGFYLISEQKHDLNLVEVKPRIKRTFWVNLYSDNRVGLYYSRKSADAFTLSERLACREIHIDCEEGEGL